MSETKAYLRLRANLLLQYLAAKYPYVPEKKIDLSDPAYTEALVLYGHIPNDIQFNEIYGHSASEQIGGAVIHTLLENPPSIRSY